MTVNRWQTVLLWPDTHVPYHHRKAVRNLIKFAGDTQPDKIVFLGDFLDMKSPARWSRGMAEEYTASLQKEMTSGRKILESLREVYHGQITYLLGNHEDRLTTYLAKSAPALSDVEALQFATLMDFDELGISLVEQPYPLTRDWLAVHGDKLGQHGGLSAMKMVERFDRSVVQGHSHRMGLVTKTVGYGDNVRNLVGLEAGHLSDINQAEYIKYASANWQMGFALLEILGDTVLPEIIPVTPRGSFRVHGVSYS
jgi:predicted phosphodiesterase